jgi:hypothetical protein
LARKLLFLREGFWTSPSSENLSVMHRTLDTMDLIGVSIVLVSLIRLIFF